MSDRTAHHPPVNVASVHCGGCSACAQSIAALESAPIARLLRAHGVTLCRAPRHSDVVLLSGALNEQARVAISAVIAGTPRPHALIAIGDCAINGCVFAGSRALTTPLAQALDVNIELAGCPPSPEAIIEAIVEAQRQLTLGHTTPATTASPHATSLPPTIAATVSGGASEPDRAARVASLLAAARTGWDDADENNLQNDVTNDDRSHLTGQRASVSMPASQRRSADE